MEYRPYNPEPPLEAEEDHLIADLAASDYDRAIDPELAAVELEWYYRRTLDRNSELLAADTVGLAI